MQRAGQIVVNLETDAPPERSGVLQLCIISVEGDCLLMVIYQHLGLEHKCGWLH